MFRLRARNWWKPALCGVSMLLYAAALTAQTLIFRSSNGDSVRLTSEPCPVGTGWLKLQRAELTYQGKKYAAFWAPSGQMVVILDEAGDVSAVPIRLFKVEEVT